MPRKAKTYPASFPIGHPLYTFEPIRDCDGYYIDYLGNVWSERSQCFMKPQVKQNRGGYLRITCRQGQKPTEIMLHQAVAEIYLGNPDPNIKDPQVNHIDHDLDNNEIFNLEWMSAKKNSSNQQKLENSSSKYIGVYYRKDNNKWRAIITHDNVKTYIQCDTEEEAKDARNAYIIKHNLDLMLN